MVISVFLQLSNIHSTGEHSNSDEGVLPVIYTLVLGKKHSVTIVTQTAKTK